MVECFLLLRHSDAKWIPFVAIPTVLAGGLAAVCLIVSGIKGILTERVHPKRRVIRTVSPDRVVQWTGPSGLRRKNDAPPAKFQHTGIT